MAWRIADNNRSRNWLKCNNERDIEIKLQKQERTDRVSSYKPQGF